MKHHAQLAIVAAVLSLPTFATTASAEQLQFKACNGHITYIDAQGGLVSPHNQFNALYEFDSVTGVGKGTIDLSVLLRSGATLNIRNEPVVCGIMKEPLPGQINVGQVACQTVRPIIDGFHFFVSHTQYSGTPMGRLHGSIQGEMRSVATGEIVTTAGNPNLKTCP